MPWGRQLAGSQPKSTLASLARHTREKATFKEQACPGSGQLS